MFPTSCERGTRHRRLARGEATTGRTAMAGPAMRGLLSWLDARRRPVFVLLPEREYRRLAATWDLPHAPVH